MQNETVDVLVIGAGPAGTIAASIINKAGYKVKIVEKEKFPRFVIGESLLPRSMEALEEAGLLDAVKAKGFQEKFGAKFVRGNELCDFNFNDQFTKGWTWTWQVKRADFDNTLAEEAARQGVDVCFETAVTGITFKGTDSTTTVVNKDGSSSAINAKFIVDASGYGRVIPRLFNLDRPSNLPTRKTLFAHIKDPDRGQYDEPNRIMVVVHEPTTWIWVIPFSDGSTSVGFVANPEFYEKTKHLKPEEQLRTLINSDPHIKKRFGDKEFLFEPRTIEGWSVTTDKFYGEGFVLTGNVTEFLDPVFSSGVTLAAASSQRAANLVIKQLKGNKVDWEEEFMKPTTIGVDTFRSYVMGWYDGTLHEIFFAKEINPDFKKQICSVLAGYVWDTSNPFVKKHDRALKSLAEVIRLSKTTA
ncbi:MAG: NAD(P)/FAD-dependent oxidoreductase [Bacteroidia bacterium]